RSTPIVSFVNKLDRDGREPLALLDEIESVLDIECAPVTWPIGMGREFRGVYHILEDCAYLYRERDGSRAGEADKVRGLDSAELRTALGDDVVRALRDEIELVRGATNELDHARYLAGRQTPVFFGAAIHNFGVKELLDAFVRLAPPAPSGAAGLRLGGP